MEITQPPIDQWNVEAKLCPLTGGHRNQVFRTVGLNRDLVFKSTTRSPGAIAWLGPVHDMARSVGFAVPRLIPDIHGNLISASWTCEPFIAGRPLSVDEFPTVLSMMARFHRAARHLPQRPGFLAARDLINNPSGGDVDLRIMPDDLVARCRAAWVAVTDRPQGVIHGDLNRLNTLKCLDGRIALLDWDEARRDHLFFDTDHLSKGDEAENRARLAWEVACSWLVEPEHARQRARHLRSIM